MENAVNMQNKSLEEIFVKNMKENTNMLKQHEQDLLELFSVELQKSFDKDMSVQCKSKGKIKYISVSVLLSSIISEEYSLGINLYDDRFYLDGNDVFGEFKIPYIHQFVSESVDETRKLFAYYQQTYKESDLAEIQKVYALGYIVKVVEMFESNIAHIVSKIQVDKSECEDMITITFGAYMEQQMELYNWEVGK